MISTWLAAAALTLTGFSPGPIFKVIAVTSAVELELADGRRAVLEDVYEFPPDADDPAQQWAQQQASTLLLGKQLSSYIGPDTYDRYGRLRLHGSIEGMWVQEVLLEAGALVLSPHVLENEDLSRLRAAEKRARGAKRGLWQAHMTVLSHKSITYDRRFNFIIMEGMIQSVTRGAKGYFLNFGPDYRTDTTLFVPSSVTRAWGGGAALKRYEGAWVEARGVLDWWNGPFLRVRRPGQIERLGNHYDRTQELKER